MREISESWYMRQINMLVLGGTEAGRAEFLRAASLRLESVLPKHFQSETRVANDPRYFEHGQDLRQSREQFETPNPERTGSPPHQSVANYYLAIGATNSNSIDESEDSGLVLCFSITPDECAHSSSNVAPNDNPFSKLPDAMLLLFDVTKDSGFDRLLGHTAGQNEEFACRALLDLQELTGDLRRNLGIDDSQRIPLPLIVILTNAEALHDCDEWMDVTETLNGTDFYGAWKTNWTEVISSAVRDFLQENSPSTLAALESDFCDIIYIPVSSVDDLPVESVPVHESASNPISLGYDVPILIAVSKLDAALAGKGNDTIQVDADMLSALKDLGPNTVRNTIEAEIGSMPGSGREVPQNPYDENVQFTVYRRKAICPEKWYPLLAFAHLDELPEDATDEEPDPIEEVRRQAHALIGPQIRAFSQIVQDSAHAVPKNGELVFVPEVEGCQFNPPQHSIRWNENVHRVEFRMKAEASLEGKTVRGCMSIFHGAILLADVHLTFVVAKEHGTEPDSRPAEVASARPYRKIFASYSHRDLAIVEQFEKYVETLGDRYLRDCKELRSGESWDDRLFEMIDESDVFQLFWSHNSMNSTFVRREWEYAVSLSEKGRNFIRPTYWEMPLPEDPDNHLPPEVLKCRQFTHIRLAVSTENLRNLEPHAERGDRQVRNSASFSAPKSSRASVVRGNKSERAAREWKMASGSKLPLYKIAAIVFVFLIAAVVIWWLATTG